MRKSPAFTLIELLIVIAIIGVLGAFSINTFVGSQKRARDATRRSDLKQYQVAIEAWSLKNNGTYPVYASAVKISGQSFGSTLCGSSSVLTLPSCPADPKDGATYGYFYRSNAGGTKYWVYAKLEGNGNYIVYCASGVNKENATEPVDADCP